MTTVDVMGPADQRRDVGTQSGDDQAGADPERMLLASTEGSKSRSTTCSNVVAIDRAWLAVGATADAGFGEAA